MKSEADQPTSQALVEGGVVLVVGFWGFFVVLFFFRCKYNFSSSRASLCLETNNKQAVAEGKKEEEKIFLSSNEEN